MALSGPPATAVTSRTRSRRRWWYALFRLSLIKEQKHHDIFFIDGIEVADIMPLRDTRDEAAVELDDDIRARCKVILPVDPSIGLSACPYAGIHDLGQVAAESARRSGKPIAGSS